ncbi:MAG: T9SS type A sorting domain-containing protein [Edaphocola sp.]
MFTLHRTLFCSVLFCSVLFCSSVRAQSGITAIYLDTTEATSGITYTATKANGASSSLSGSGNYTYSFGDSSGFTDNTKTLKAFTSGGSGYTYTTGDSIVVKIRRVENAAMATYRSTYSISVDTPMPRDLAYYEGKVDNTAKTVKIKSPYIPKMEDLFLSNDIAIGIDNLFANTYATNFNNIERIDVIAPKGVAVLSPAAQGFALFERGVYNGHDPVAVALITKLDANGAPSAYASTVLHMVAANYQYTGQTTNVYQPSNTLAGNFIVLRRDDTTGVMQASDLISAAQGIGGVLIKYSDFGSVAVGDTVYGYSVFADDFPATGTGANVIDYTDTTYFPTTSADATGAAGNDMATITGVVKLLHISGNVFHDANGLTDSLVNGTGIDSASSVRLYVNLVDANGIVVGVDTVNSDGSYSFDKLAFGALTVQLTTNPGTIGSAAPAISLPSGWANTGEAYGTNNNSGSGNETGTANGSIAVSILDVDITDVNFGIEKTPESDNKTYTLSTQPVGGSSYSLSGLTTGTTGATPPLMSGSDPEDSTYTGNDGITNDPQGVIITSLPTNGELYYNGVLVTAADTGITVFADPSLFTIKLTGNGYTSTSFGYAYVDTAGVADPTPATYTLNWSSPLPVGLANFDAYKNGSVAELVWTTASETNNKGFEVERSTDSRSWTSLGFVNSQAENGNSSSELGYAFTDETPATGTDYYRLKQTDLDGRYAYSAVRTVSFGKESIMVIYPNPVKDNVTIQGLQGNEQIKIYDANGRVVAKTQANSATMNISLSALSNGTYHINIVDADGKVSSHKVVKK